jgi:CHRD domain
MRRCRFTAVAAAALIAFLANCACAQEFIAHLTGFDEIGEIPGPYQNGDGFPYTGAILSNGTGTATLYLDQQAGTITYTLTYSNVGTTPPLTGTVTQAHIHFGKSRDSGGILVFFCTNEGNGPTGVTTPSCPTPSGTVTGTWTKDNVVAVDGENVTAGDFNALVNALASNTAYANVHQTGIPSGEIRGQFYPVKQEHGN